MIKDTFFSLPRFMNLCRKEMVESWKSNVLRIVLLYGVMTVVLVWNGYFAYRTHDSVRFLERHMEADPAWGVYINSFSLVSIRIWLFKRVADNGEDEKQDKQAVCINDTGYSF